MCSQLLPNEKLMVYVAYAPWVDDTGGVHGAGKGRVLPRQTQTIYSTKFTINKRCSGPPAPLLLVLLGSTSCSV